MKKILPIILLFLFVLIVPELSFAQIGKTVETVGRGLINATGEMPNWISSLGVVFLDSLSPLAYSMSESLSGLVRTFIFIFLLFYVIGLGINLIRGKTDFQTSIKVIVKRVSIIALSLGLLSIPPKYIYENTINPILQITSQYTNGFIINADENYAPCLEKYKESASNIDREVLTAETKASLVCPINTSAKQIDVMTRMGVWFVGTAVSEYIVNIAVEWVLNVIPYVGKALSKIYSKTVSVYIENIVYLMFTIGVFFLTQGFKLAIDILWTLLKLIMQLTIPVMFFPLSVFSYAFETEETGFLGYAKGWRKNFLTMFENGVIGFLFWSISIGILGIFLQYIFNGLVIQVPNTPGITTADLMNSQSVFYDANGEIKDATIFGLAMSLHNPFNLGTWLKFMISFQMAIFVFELFKKESASYIQDTFVKDIKSYADQKVNTIQTNITKYHKDTTKFLDKYIKSKK